VLSANAWRFPSLPGGVAVDSQSKKIPWKFRFLEFRIMPSLPIKSLI